MAHGGSDTGATALLSRATAMDSWHSTAATDACIDAVGTSIGRRVIAAIIFYVGDTIAESADARADADTCAFAAADADVATDAADAADADGRRIDAIILYFGDVIVVSADAYACAFAPADVASAAADVANDDG